MEKKYYVILSHDKRFKYFLTYNSFTLGCVVRDFTGSLLGGVVRMFQYHCAETVEVLAVWEKLFNGQIKYIEEGDF